MATQITSAQFATMLAKQIKQASATLELSGIGEPGDWNRELATFKRSLDSVLTKMKREDSPELSQPHGEVLAKMIDDARTYAFAAKDFHDQATQFAKVEFTERAYAPVVVRK